MITEKEAFVFQTDRTVEKFWFVQKWNSSIQTFTIPSFADLILWVTAEYSAQVAGELVSVPAPRQVGVRLCSPVKGSGKKFCGMSLTGGQPAWPYEENGTCAPQSWLNKSYLHIQDQTRHGGLEEQRRKTEGLDLDLTVRTGFTAKWRRLCLEFWAWASCFSRWDSSLCFQWLQITF